MCRSVHVRVTPADARAVRKMYGVMVPVVASIMALFVVAAALTHQPRADKVLTADAAAQPVSAVAR